MAENTAACYKRSRTLKSLKPDKNSVGFAQENMAENTATCHKRSRTLKSLKPDKNSAGFPQDLVSDILSRLTVKSLSRFSCVSKQWCSLISDSHFLNLHYQYSKKNPRFVFVKEISRKKNQSAFKLCSMDLKGVIQNEFQLVLDDYVYKFASCCDLVCFVGDSHVYVCNPSTQEFLKSTDGCHDLCKEFAVGFGYVASRNEYKVVNLFPRFVDVDSFVIECEIFTVRNGDIGDDGCWKLISDICPFQVAGWSPSASVGGIIYWMTWDMKEGLVTLDLEKEEFGIVDCPETIDNEYDTVKLTEFLGYLCIVEHVNQENAVDVWILKDREKCEWVKEYRINFYDWVDYSVRSTYIPMDVRDGEIFIDEVRKSFFYLNPEAGYVRKVENSELKRKSLLMRYFDSFFSLRG